MSLKKARELAAEAHALRRSGVDPIEARRARRASAALEAAKAMTFDQCRDAFIADNKTGWRNAKHQAQWTSTLRTYATPIIGALPVQAIDVVLVMKILQPIWSTKPETASRVRGRIERVLDWAKVSGFRTGENPARWRGHLDQLLPKKSKVRKVEHHAALPYGELPDFMVALRARTATSARALEFAVLTAARTGEVIGARWDEIDLQAKAWTVSAERMKAGREHRVPLSAAALAVLECMQKVRQNDYVFAGERHTTLSNTSMLMLLRRMCRSDLTAHGFRSTFRTWAAERTSFPREVVEAALAHVVGDATEQAYQRSNLFDKRRRLMDAWAEFCRKPATSGGVGRYTLGLETDQHRAEAPPDDERKTRCSCSA